MNPFFVFATTAALVLVFLPASTMAGTVELERLIDKMEMDVLELAKAVEAAFQDRCTTALNDCGHNNFDSCVSQFPSPTCYKSDEFATNCSTGNSDTCAALFDFNSSNVVLPSKIANGNHGNPTNPQVIESVCYTRQLDEFFLNKRSTDVNYWRSFGVDSPPMFFGSQEGMFRIFPGRHYEKCGAYDPRVRPWYIAASSGPKNVVLVLDISGSMISGTGQRFVLLKQAAIHVIETLTVGDRIAIVAFSSSARVIGDSEGRLLTANSTNKDFLVKAVNDLAATGATNFLAALGSAFDTLDKTIEAELNNNCNSAILFLTDGVMTDPKNASEQNVIDLVATRLNATMHSSGKPILFFTYSIGAVNDDVHRFPRELACSTELGVWSKIDDELKLFESLTSYYRLFALGLGNKDFVAWVEPYKFATGGVVGTTVSAPVYDRAHNPPLFLGVVGMNFPLSAINKALGSDTGNEAAVQRIVQASTANCPSLNLTLCELESFRRLSSAGDEAICDVNACTASDFVQVEAAKCPSVADYPDYLWMNANYIGKPYFNRVCCKLGETVPSDTCPVAPISYSGSDAASTSSISTALMAGVSAGVVLALLILGFVWRQRRRRIFESGKIALPKLCSDSRKVAEKRASHLSVRHQEQRLDENYTTARHPSQSQAGTLVVMPPPCVSEMDKGWQELSSSTPHRESPFADAAISLHQFHTPSFANDINNHVMLSTPTAPHQVDFGSSSTAASFGGGTCGGV